MKADKSMKNRFNSIDGLRTIACFGIVLMHIKANIGYLLPGYWLNTIISSFVNFVFLFMSISAFVLCCGYYEKIKNNQISPTKFYSRRIYRLLPFFILLTIMDLILEHNLPSLVESFANSTLLFGLLGKEITVIGVGWFIGLLFIFYLMFPYFTYLFSNKKKAWFVTIIAILMNLSCVYYFNVGMSNMFYSFIYFCIGALLYLYKDTITGFFKGEQLIGFLLLILSIILFYLLPMFFDHIELLRNIILIMTMLSYAISFDSKVLNNRITSFIGNISLEIYLCHMLVFRIIEKIGLINMLNKSWMSFLILSIIILFGAILFSWIYKIVWNYMEKRVKNQRLIHSELNQ